LRRRPANLLPARYPRRTASPTIRPEDSTRSLTDREGRSVAPLLMPWLCALSFKSTPPVPVACGSFRVVVNAYGVAAGTSGLDQGKRRGHSVRAWSRAHRSRQRAAIVRGRRELRLGRPPPRLGAVVQRHYPHRPVRRALMGAPFSLPSTARPICHRAGAHRGDIAPDRRRRRRPHRQCRAQAIACRRRAKPMPRARSFANPPHAGSGTARSCACARSCAWPATWPLVSELSANIPPFNPQKMLAQAEGISDTAAEDAGTEPDAEVSFVTRDLTPCCRARRSQPWWRPTRCWRACAMPQTGTRHGPEDGHVTDSIPSSLIPYAPERNGDVYGGFEPRIVPENVTLLPKTTAQVTGAMPGTSARSCSRR